MLAITNHLGKTTNHRLQTILVSISLVYLGLLVYRWYRNHQEGFASLVPLPAESTFLVKHNQEIYDPFYASIYNRIYQPEIQAKQIYEFVTSFTQNQPQTSVFLDIGAGTGETIQYFESQGYLQVYGVESSAAMIEFALQKYPQIKIQQGDVSKQPMLYDKNTFTHILCTGTPAGGNPLYQLPDLSSKRRFLETCFSWLIPTRGGYLILQLCDPSHFSTLPPAAHSQILENDPNDQAETRIRNSEITFHDFQYKSNYVFPTTTIPGTTVSVTETFSNQRENPRQVRQNEMTLYLDEIQVILNLAKECGFAVRGQVDMDLDPHQHLYLLERTQ